MFIVNMTISVAATFDRGLLGPGWTIKIGTTGSGIDIRTKEKGFSLRL